MKILFFIDIFGSSNFGGSIRVFYETAKMLIGEGHTIDVICRTDGTTDVFTLKGANFYTYIDVSGNSFLRFAHYAKYCRKVFRKYINSNRPELIMIHSSTSVMGLKKHLYRLKIPIIYVFHSPWAEEYKVIHGGEKMGASSKISYWLRKHHEAAYLGISCGIVTLSEYMKNLMLEIHPETAKIPIRVIPGGADTEKFYPAENPDEVIKIREKLFLPQNKFIIITVRRLIRRTGIDILVRAFAEFIKKNSKDSCLVIVGQGSMTDELKKLVCDLNIEGKVIFTGFVGENELPYYYWASDLFVMPTRELEGFGLSTVESLACGLPVMGTNIGGTPEILSKISAKLLIEECSVKSIYEGLSKFIELDTEDIAEIKKNSIEAVKSLYNWKRHVAEIVKFSQEISKP